MRCSSTSLRIGSCSCLLLCLVAVADGATLRLRLRDALSGLPTAARVQIDGPSGALFSAPDSTLCTHSWLPIGPYLAAEDELLLEDLAPGSYTVRARRGSTGLLSVQTIALSGGEYLLQLLLADWVDPTALGWFAGDPHVHGDHEGGQVYAALSGAQLATAAAAEGLPLIFSLDNDLANAAGLRATSMASSVHWGIEYRNGWWGHAALLGLPAPPTSMGCCAAGGSGLLPLSATLPLAGAELTLLSHPHTTDLPILGGAWPWGGHGREAFALSLLAGTAAYAVGSGSNGPVSNWDQTGYLDLIRTGGRLSAVGESDAALDRYTVRPPGFSRTYAHLEAAPAPTEPAFATAWLDAVRAGRCYASDGPVLLEFSLADRMLGETLHLLSAVEAELHLRLVSELGLRHVRLHGQSGMHREWSWSSNGPTSFEDWIDLGFAHDDFVLLEVEATAAHGITHLVSSPIWIDTEIARPEPIASARRAADDLRRFFVLGTALRGFASPAEEALTTALILGAADTYEAMADDPPGAFTLLYPSYDQTLPSTAATFRWRRAFSFDGEPTSYELWLDDDSAFSSPTLAGATQDSSLVVANLPVGVDVHWRVLAVEPGEAGRANQPPNGLFRVSGNPVEAPAATGTDFALGPAHCDGALLRLSIDIQRASNLDFRWYDVRGRLVRAMPPQHFEVGAQEVQWDGRDDRGAPIAAGAYWVAARSDAGVVRTLLTPWQTR